MRVYLGAVALLAACGAQSTEVDPGRVTLHRLNKAEYNNTIRELTGTGLEPAAEFPADDRAYGFDTIADALRLGTLHMELYETAASNVLTDVLALTVPSSVEQLEVTGTSAYGGPQDGGFLFYAQGESTLDYVAAGPGRYHVKIRAYQHLAGAENAKLAVAMAGQPPFVIDVSALQASPGIYELDFTFEAGPQQLTIAFVNDAYDEPTMADRNVWVDYVELEGPLDAPDIDETRRARIFTCAALSSTSCQDEILSKFTSRAWRRPVTADEMARLRAIVSNAIAAGDTAEVGLRNALQAVLVSPHFLFRVELDPDPAARTPHPLGAYELASRLSYFLWSSMPDDELFAAAESGALLEPTELERHVRRMLDDERSVALVDNFAGQWLFTRALGDQDPEYALFPDYDDELERAMREETRRYFLAFLHDDVPMNQFLTADFTYANDRLAAFYGLPLPGTTDHVRVSLEGSQRRGFLTQASFLRVTSQPKRTSPVKRGKWVLDNLLCAPPAAPPPGVESFEETDPTGTQTLRERFEEHRKNPVCAGCHSTMDPIGFALDNYDAIGQFRTVDEVGLPIDASGTLFESVTFSNALELTTALAEVPNVYRCMVEKLYTYSGRPPTRIDAIEHVEELTTQFIAGGYSLRELIVAMTTHPSFTSRRGEP